MALIAELPPSEQPPQSYGGELSMESEKIDSSQGHVDSVDIPPAGLPKAVASIKGNSLAEALRADREPETPVCGS